MTNAEIIFNERVNLMEAGKIGTTGRKLVVETTEGNKIEIQEPEQIHTYQAWKSLGYQVKKGEKAVAKFHIWKYTEKVIENGEDEETIKNMFMKCSAFFSASQVESVKENGAA